ncbi:MAG: hypothetical protein GF329_18170 [Candidatus Lokiarchaeota archaeon]|nr:hypothetical protein [Candidatus Lokiarchaeota archaeon]
MTEDHEFIRQNDKILRQKIAGIDYELKNNNLKKFIDDLDEYINLLATYPGKEEKVSEFIDELIERISNRSNLKYYDLYFYHICTKLAEFYSLSRNDYLNAIQRLITAIRSYSIAFDMERDLQIFIDILKLKIYASLQNDMNFRNELIQEVDELFIQFLKKIKNKNVYINGNKVKKNQFFEIKSNILEFSLILFLINQNNGNDEIYRRLEDIFIYFREIGFNVYVLGKALGTLILENSPD